MKIKLPKQLSNIRLANTFDIFMCLVRKGAVHAFELSIAFIIISIFLGVLVYFRYRTPEAAEVISPKPESTRFQSDLYQEALKKLEERQTEFQKAAEERYADPFYPERLTIPPLPTR